MSILAQILLALLVAMFLVYLVIELRAVRKNASPGNASGSSVPPGECPKGMVSVLLPVYNEKLVVANLIHAVSALDYDRNDLEILVLDDSTDDTTKLIARLIAEYQARGVPIHHLRRQRRIGYKAGNLNFGLSRAKGDFIAIFDADCLPPPDFLKKLLPAFKDPALGFLQTRIAYFNANVSILTSFQATEAYHKEAVTSGFSRDGFMASLTGSSCIWRRRCIDAIGGISPDTITEDVDMGYAAQISNWKYMFPDNVVSWAELPESMASFRVQRQRWARGLVHNAFRHGRELLGAPMGALAKIHAITLVFSPLLLALFYSLLLICPIISAVTPSLGAFFHIVCSIFLVAAIIWGWANTSGSGSGPKSSLFGVIKHTLAYILLFFPLSLYYFSAIIQTLLVGRGEFYTTPKGIGRGKVAHPPINRILLALEAGSFCYALFSLWFSLYEHNYWVCLYSALALGGFGMTLFFSFSDSLKTAPLPNTILITGASGAIGSALALEYAAPGRLLILQGRDAGRLEAIAALCEKKGAATQGELVDLADTEAVREWAANIARTELPDLVIANAGLNTNIGPGGQGEPYAESMALVRVNLLSVIALVDGLLPAMRKRKKGQIAIMSSLAAYYGLIQTPTYCATKGALKNWGASLRGWLAPEGIMVSVIFPGYVKSSMCDAMPGPKPFLWTPAKAARKIRRCLARNQGRISFPFPLNLGMWALSILPLFIAMPIARLLGYGR